MGHRFVILKQGELLTFDDYDQIPNQFEALIEFLPEIPPEPHTHEQHKEIDSWQGKFLRLLEISDETSSNSR